MASLSSDNTTLSVTCGFKTYAITLSGNKLFCIDHVNIKKNQIENGKPETVDCDEIGVGLLSCDLSPDGSLLAFCTYSKKLCIVNTKNFDVANSKVFSLSRGASKIRFTPSTNRVVVADKSGDVYLFDPVKLEDLGTRVLGHLSLLLDVLVSSDEKFIITCDRDEKIRVSNFPNGYSIITYCLGHTEFVSSVAFLPHQNNYLLSTSGDGTLRFWNYKIGKELLVYNAFQYLMSSSDGSDEDFSAITDSAAMFVDSKTSLVCACLDHINVCLVIKCSSNTGSLQCSVIQTVTLGNFSPWRMTVTANNVLWLLLNSKDKVMIKAMILDKNLIRLSEELPESVSSVVSLMNEQNIIIDFKKNIVNLLFKRKFDNVQDYLQRKDERVTSQELSNKKTKK